MPTPAFTDKNLLYGNFNYGIGIYPDLCTWGAKQSVPSSTSGNEWLQTPYVNTNTGLIKLELSSDNVVDINAMAKSDMSGATTSNAASIRILRLYFKCLKKPTETAAWGEANTLHIATEADIPEGVTSVAEAVYYCNTVTPSGIKASIQAIDLLAAPLAVDTTGDIYTSGRAILSASQIDALPKSLSTADQIRALTEGHVKVYNYTNYGDGTEYGSYNTLDTDLYPDVLILTPSSGTAGAAKQGDKITVYGPDSLAYTFDMSFDSKVVQAADSTFHVLARDGYISEKNLKRKDSALEVGADLSEVTFNEQIAYETWNSYQDGSINQDEVLEIIASLGIKDLAELYQIAQDVEVKNNVGGESRKGGLYFSGPAKPADGNSPGRTGMPKFEISGVQDVRVNGTQIVDSKYGTEIVLAGPGSDATSSSSTVCTVPFTADWSLYGMEAIEKTAVFKLADGNATNDDIKADNDYSAMYLYNGYSFRDPGFMLRGANDEVLADTEAGLGNAEVKRYYVDSGGVRHELGQWSANEEITDFVIPDGEYSATYDLIYEYTDVNGKLITATRKIYVISMRGDLNGDGSYIMTAAADGEYTLSVSPASSIRAKAEVYTVGDAVRGQTNAKFTGVGGAYVCMVTYTDGTELQSDLIIIKKSDTPSHPIVVGLPFDDVKTDDWFYDDVKTAYEAGLMVGTENNKFSPNMGTTRAMATLVLWRLAGCPEPEKSVTFSDVKSGTYYEPAVRWAAENNIVQGIGGGLFAPDALVTREQMSAMLFRHMCYIIESDWTADNDAWEALRKFPDQPSYWAREAMCWAIDKQIILGREGQLAPKESATRAELCAIVMRYIEIDRHLKQIAGL